MDAQDGTMVAVMLSSTPADRLARARLALEGLSLGDAFGEQFFVRSGLLGQLIAERALPAPPWRFTDDTPMALSVAGSLVHFDRIDQDWLAQSFAGQYQPSRGYGLAMHHLLPAIGAGAAWRELSAGLFGQV